MVHGTIRGFISLGMLETFLFYTPWDVNYTLTPIFCATSLKCPVINDDPEFQASRILKLKSVSLLPKYIHIKIVLNKVDVKGQAHNQFEYAHAFQS